MTFGHLNVHLIIVHSYRTQIHAHACQHMPLVYTHKKTT